MSSSAIAAISANRFYEIGMKFLSFLRSQAVAPPSTASVVAVM